MKKNTKSGNTIPLKKHTKTKKQTAPAQTHTRTHIHAHPANQQQNQNKGKTKNQKLGKNNQTDFLDRPVSYNM